MMQKTKKSRNNNRSQGCGWTSILLSFVIVFAFFVISFALVSHFHLQDSQFANYLRGLDPRQRSTNQIDMAEFEKLFLRASELKRKYDELKASTSGKGDISIRSADSADLDNKGADSSSLSDLVIGMAKDLDPKNLAVFGKSLRQVSKAKVVLFVNNPIPERHKIISKSCQLELIPFDSTTMGFSVDMNKFHPSTSRWPLIHKYLSDHGTKYNRIWMLDVRDTYFQSDPFEFMSPTDKNLNVFQGVESMKISQCGWNSAWVSDCFGKEILNSIGNNPIICSGVTSGFREAVITYTSYMSGLILSSKEELDLANNMILSKIMKASIFPSCERNGVDQGIHNVLIHSNVLPNVKIWQQSTSPVANMQSKLAIIRNQVVYNKAGEKVAVVHQYDRNSDLQKYLFEKYVDWMDTSDLQSEWDLEPSCTEFQYKQDLDMFKGMCDLKTVGGATSAVTCCSSCEAVEECKAFTFASGLCYLKSCSSSMSHKYHAIPGVVSGFQK
mmetsp:Transcript_21615/g.30983  ORF Transcript_21615/g.30983 Transcript_21615/m.30983 type:complete len:498 (+) Transcript_21615:3-1496(+)